jgi:hypothetical protein
VEIRNSSIFSERLKWLSNYNYNFITGWISQRNEIRTVSLLKTCLTIKWKFIFVRRVKSRDEVEVLLHQLSNLLLYIQLQSPATLVRKIRGERVISF